MDLNTFGADLIKQLSRIANSAEVIEQKLGGKVAVSNTVTTPAADEPAAAKTTRATKPKPEATKSSKPVNDRDAVKKALITVKDTISKEAAQKVYQKFGYEAMSAIEEKDFDAIFAEATKVLEAAEQAGDEPVDEDDL